MIAANVLHATADLRRTLAHVQRLLVPGGLLCLQEMTEEHRFIDLSFGLTPGWWKQTDLARRPTSPLLDRAGWLELLDEAGFTSAAAAPDAADEHLALQTVLLAASPAGTDDVPTVAERIVAARRTWLILADRAGVGERLAGQLVAAGGRVTTVAAPGAGSVAAPDRHQLDASGDDELDRVVAGAPDGGWDGVVHLWGLDDAAPGSLDGQHVRLGSAVSLLQTLARGGQTSRTWFVTRGAQAVDGGAADPWQAPLWGLARVAAL